VEPTMIIALLSALFVATDIGMEACLDGQPARRELASRNLFTRNPMD
jgi:hypothetical protein